MFKTFLQPKMCCICGKPVFANRSKYCWTCSIFALRIYKKQLPPETVKDLWDYVRKYGHVCYYTGMPLEVHDSSSPWYCVLDHWIPHDSGKVVFTSALLNDMKSDLSEEEFWYYIQQLADHKWKHTKVRKKKLVYWFRLYLTERSV